MQVVNEGFVNSPEEIIHLYSISVHILLTVSRVIVATPVLILPANSGKIEANCGTYAAFLWESRYVSTEKGPDRCLFGQSTKC
jgi:hypothetical protein